MAISHMLPPASPVDQPSDPPTSDESAPPSPRAGARSPPAEGEIGGDGEVFAQEMAVVVAAAAKRPRHALLQSSPSCCRMPSSARSQLRRCGGGDADAHLLSRLSSQLASLRALIPPTARSGDDKNLIAEALRYKKVLSNEIEVLQRAFPYTKQVSVQRIGNGGLQIKVSCEKRAGLLVALMEAIESSGITLTTVNVSCQGGKIRINSISTVAASNQRTASLKVILVATIMRFNG